MSWFRKPAIVPPEIEPPPPPPPPANLRCSFCDKSQREVKKLIAGPSAHICDECVVTCTDVLAGEAPPPKVEVPSAGDLEAALDAHAVGQRAAKRAIVAALRGHLAGSAQPDSDLRAPRLLLVGPSGSGKTTLGRAIAGATTLPSYHADVSRLSEGGYVGEDLENLLTTLIEQADHDTARAQRGVLVLDGLEKLEARRPLGGSRDISGEGVQRELIRLLDGLGLRAPIQYANRHPQAETKPFACRTLFLAATARLDPVPPRATERDLRAALAAIGILPEVLARFDRVVPLPLPDVGALLGIFDHPRGPLSEARRVVEALGGSLRVTPTALRTIAEAAAASAEGPWLLGQVVARQLEEILTAPITTRAWEVDERRARALLAEVTGA